MEKESYVYDVEKSEVLPLCKASSRKQNLVKMLSRGKVSGKTQQLLLQEEDYFYNLPVIINNKILMLGDDHIHIVDLESFTSEIKSWTIFNDQSEEKILVQNKWRS